MGSQQYGIGAGLQSLGNSMMQAATMYSLLNEDPKELEEELTPEQKTQAAREQAQANASTTNTDEDIGNAYDNLNPFGAITDEEEAEWYVPDEFNNFKNFGKNLDSDWRTSVYEDDSLNPYELLGGRL